MHAQSTSISSTRAPYRLRTCFFLLRRSLPWLKMALNSRSIAVSLHTHLGARMCRPCVGVYVFALLNGQVQSVIMHGCTHPAPDRLHLVQLIGAGIRDCTGTTEQHGQSRDVHHDDVVWCVCVWVVAVGLGPASLHSQGDRNCTNTATATYHALSLPMPCMVVDAHLPPFVLEVCTWFFLFKDPSRAFASHTHHHLSIRFDLSLSLSLFLSERWFQWVVGKIPIKN